MAEAAEFLQVLEGKKHAWDPHSQGPVCGDTEDRGLRYDPRQVECKKCRMLILKAWLEVDD